MKKIFLASTAVALAIIASAAVADGPGTDLSKATSGVYEIDPSHTNVIWGINHMGFSTYYGRFNKIEGTLNFDAKAPEKSKLDVTINPASVDTNNEKLQAELVSPQWFDTAKYPRITFVSTKIEKLNATGGKVTGDLTLHGVTKPVTLDVTFNGVGANPIMKVEQLGFAAKGKIKRSDFNVSQYLPMVGDEVELTIASELHLKPAEGAAPVAVAPAPKKQ